MGSGGAAVAAGAGGGHNVKWAAQPVGTRLGAAVGNVGSVAGVTAGGTYTTTGGGTVAKANCCAGALLAVAATGGNVAPGASVMYGKVVTRCGGIGNFFGKQLQNLEPQHCGVTDNSRSKCMPMQRIMPVLRFDRTQDARCDITQ